MSLKFTIHYGFHFIVPLIIALMFFNKKWKQVYLIFVGTMLIDLDHLLAYPIFNTDRCSINFHPLHSYYAIVCYIFLLFPIKTRVFAMGILIHIIADTIDCYL